MSEMKLQVLSIQVVLFENLQIWVFCPTLGVSDITKERTFKNDLNVNPKNGFSTLQFIKLQVIEFPMVSKAFNSEMYFLPV